MQNMQNTAYARRGRDDRTLAQILENKKKKRVVKRRSRSSKTSSR